MMLSSRSFARIGSANTRLARFASSITIDKNGVLSVPNDPIIPFIEGDGTGE
jgi:hypothetical protein